MDWNNPGVVINGIIESTGAKNTHEHHAPSSTSSRCRTTTSRSRTCTTTASSSFARFVSDSSCRTSLANRFNATSVNIAVVGRNLWTNTNVPNIDPEIAYNTGANQGLEYAGLPVPRSFGFNVRVTP